MYNRTKDMQHVTSIIMSLIVITSYLLPIFFVNCIHSQILPLFVFTFVLVYIYVNRNLFHRIYYTKH